MAMTTPGIDFLLRGVLKYILPNILFVFLLHRVSLSHFNVPISTPLLVLIGLFAIPCYAAVRIAWFERKVRREAEKFGARVVPKVKGKWWANLDVLKDMNWYWHYGYLGDGITALLEKYGPAFNFYVLWDASVFTVCPEHIKIILATDFVNYEKGERFHETMAPVLGTGVFNSDGSMWKFHRSMTRPFFSRNRISHFELFDRHAEIVIKRIKERMREGEEMGVAVDFQDLMGRFTLDSATDFLFGSCVHSLSGTLPYPHNYRRIAPYGDFAAHADNVAEHFASAFLLAQEAIASRERLGPVWPLWEIWEDKTKEPMKVVNAVIEPIIAEAIRKHDAEKKLGVGEKRRVDGDDGEVEIGDDETLLDHLVKFTSDPVVLKDETLNIMIAGRDTTAGTLTVLIYFLCIYPSVFDRLRAEVLNKVGRNKRPTYEDIREMKYLRAVINETMRLYPIVPFNVRTAINPTTWPSPDPSDPRPLYIPGGTKSTYSVYIMQRRKDLWGPDAEEFDPDRFLDDRLKKYLISNNFAFLPFNAGPRICLGQQFAYNEISFMVIKLLQNFDSFVLDEAAQPPDTRPRPHWKEDEAGKGMTRKAVEKFYPRVTLTLYAYGGLWVKMREASE